MNQKLILISSVAVTAFVLVSIGAIIAVANTPKVDAAAIQEYQQRENQYQQMIAQANQQIELANQQIQTLSTPQNNVSNAANPPGNPASIAPQQAAQVALDLANPVSAAMTKTPELVNYQGQLAYEVVFDKGSVYVDAATGKVLFSSLPTLVTPEQAAQIAGKYLGGLNPKYSTTTIVDNNGKEIYKVVFSAGYTVFLDKSGQVLSAQVERYSSASASDNQGGSHSGNNDGGDDDEHEDEHDD